MDDDETRRALRVLKERLRELGAEAEEADPDAHHRVILSLLTQQLPGCVIALVTAGPHGLRVIANAPAPVAQAFLESAAKTLEPATQPAGRC